MTRLRSLTPIMLIALALLAIPAVAQARPELSLARANHATEIAVADDVAEWNAGLAEVLVEGEGEVEPQDTIIGSAIEPCDRETRYRALCDYSYGWGDGYTSDCTLTVVIGVHGYLHLYRSEEEGC